MAYSINPNLLKARALALQLHIRNGISRQVTANRCGVHRSTVWRWKIRWLEMNENVQLKNFNRPTRVPGTAFRQAALRWLIPTQSSRPLTSPKTIDEHIVRRILEIRNTLNRCTEVVWNHLNRLDGIRVSLSSVRRTLKRHHCFDGARKNRARPDNPRRPRPTYPGELVQTDTIHYICPITYRRRYVYTVIDLYSRMTYTEIHNKIGPGIAATTIKKAQEACGFRFSMVQADNGPEFSRYLEKKLATDWQILLLHMRPKIEATFGRLKEHHFLVTSFPRSVKGYFVHYIRTLLGYQMGAIS